MRGRRKIACYTDQDGGFYCLSVPARTSDRELARLVAEERERQVGVKHLWNALLWLLPLHEARHGGVPASFTPDDGDRQVPPLVRRVLWVVWRNRQAEWWDRMEELLTSPVG